MGKNNNAKFHQSIIINLVTFAKVNLVLCTTNGQKNLSSKLKGTTIFITETNDDKIENTVNQLTKS